MPRQGMDEQVRSGIISPNIAAGFISRQANTVRGWLKKRLLKPLKSPGQRDIRVSSLELLLFLLENSHPFDKMLVVSALNYAKRFEPQHIKLTSDLLFLYEKHTQQDRILLKAVLDNTSVDKRLQMKPLAEFDEDGKQITQPPQNIPSTP